MYEKQNGTGLAQYWCQSWRYWLPVTAQYRVNAELVLGRYRNDHTCPMLALMIVPVLIAVNTPVLANPCSHRLPSTGCQCSVNVD